MSRGVVYSARVTKHLTMAKQPARLASFDGAFGGLRGIRGFGDTDLAPKAGGKGADDAMSSQPDTNNTC